MNVLMNVVVNVFMKVLLNEEVKLSASTYLHIDIIESCLNSFGHKIDPTIILRT